MAALQSIFVDERRDVNLSGKNAVPYEVISGTATTDSGAQTRYSMLKPRDPANTSGTLVLIVGEKFAPDLALMKSGYTVLRIQSEEPTDIRDLVAYLRYGGQVRGFALGDQRRFLKRAILVAPGQKAGSLIPIEANQESKPYFEGVVVTDNSVHNLPKTLPVQTGTSRVHVAVAKLDAQLKSTSK